MTGRLGFGPGAMGRPGGPGRMGPGFAPGLSMPAPKSAHFRRSFRRLLGELRPERGWILLVLAFGVVSVVLAVIGPKLLGEATNIIFAGFVGQQLLPDAPQQRRRPVAAVHAQRLGEALDQPFRLGRGARAERVGDRGTATLP